MNNYLKRTIFVKKNGNGNFAIHDGVAHKFDRMVVENIPLTFIV